jgi:rare lipoprotein A
LLIACGEHHPTQVSVSPAPPITAPTTAEPPTIDRSSQSASSRKSNRNGPAGEDSENEGFDVPPSTEPLLVETGLASWYGPPYNERRGANGKIYNMNALTAAHRTLPMGSIVRVINTKTGTSAIVEITDRGPFVEGRILDLSLAAAKKTGVWRAGVAPVRMEVLRAPSPINSGGRWAVQIGAFEEEHAANKLADHLSKRYQSAKVLCFSSPVGDWWVRVRVPDDEKKRAEEIAHKTESPEGGVFLVRLD